MAARRTTAPPRPHPLQLYREAVQAPEHDAAQFAAFFARHRGREPASLREDFCGTAALATEAVRLLPGLRALGVDRDAATLAWARDNSLASLPPRDRTRLRLRCADVRRVNARADLILATNFSYCVFHERAELLAYLRHARRCLTPQGYLVLDLWGGGLTHRTFRERHQHVGFAHVWEQRAFDPISHRVDCRIHFELPGGRRLRNAFVYDWRMWTLPELRDLCAEAGMPAQHVLWRDGQGRLRERQKVPAQPTWICYLAAGRGAR